MAATESITSIILIKLIRVSLGTVRHPRRFQIVVIDIPLTLKQMLRDFIGIRVNRAKKSGMVNITSSVNSRERSFFFTDPPTPEIYTLSLHDALPIWLVAASAIIGDLTLGEYHLSALGFLAYGACGFLYHDDALYI